MDIIDKSHKDWHFFQNPFLNATKNSHKRFAVLNSDHLSKLKQNAGNPAILPLLQRYQPLHDVFNGTYANLQNTRQEYLKACDLVRQKEKDLMHVSAMWKAAVVAIYHRTTHKNYLFPNGLKPFQGGGHEKRLLHVKTLSERLTEYPDLAALQLTVRTFYDEFWALRHQQQQLEYQLNTASDEAIIAHQEAAQMMFRNLCVLLDIYDGGYTVAHFFDLSVVRRNRGKGKKTKKVSATTELATETLLPDDGEAPHKLIKSI